MEKEVKKYVERTEVYNLRTRYESFYFLFKEQHQQILNILENLDCISEENYDKLYSVLKEYQSDLDKFESLFLILESDANKVKSLYNPTILLKKKRVATLASRMKDESDGEYDPLDLPF